MKLEAAESKIGKAERGSWELVAAVDVPSDWHMQQEKHKQAQKKLPPHQQTENMAPMCIATSAGYIVFPDKLTVISTQITWLVHLRSVHLQAHPLRQRDFVVGLPHCDARR